MTFLQIDPECGNILNRFWFCKIGLFSLVWLLKGTERRLIKWMLHSQPQQSYDMPGGTIVIRVK
uniref:Uncharacterized protein n=1 Tax=viral metagenome TaxID=1070528 RepID=A0A6M3JNY1_9ZZZZ